ncbi:MAG: DNA polymerase III subunit delta [Gammaproteobacteria bacterium]
MQLRPERLAAELSARLLPAWLVFGDEPLIVLECADAIRAAARAAGCTERDVLNVEGSFDWNRLREAAGNLSLFGDKRLIELRLDRVPSPDGQKAIVEWCARAGDDTVLLVTAGALEKKQQNAEWVQAIGQAGATVQAWPVPRAELPAWIRRRLAARGVSADDAALEFLADRVEGNLLAAQQEIDRIVLLFGQGAVGVEQLSTMIADNARYDLEGTLDAALAGDAARALRMLEGLREEGESTVPLLWLVQRDVRGLLLAAELVAQGRGEQAALQAAGVWASRQNALLPALKRLRVPALRALLADCAKTEKTNKGQAPGSAWDAMATLLLRIAGRKAPPGTGREIV